MSKAIRITIDVSPTFHKMLKVYTGSIGQTIKDVFINSVTKEMKETISHASNKDLQECSSKEFNQLMDNAVNLIESNNYSEEEDDKILAPYLIEMVRRIENGEEKGKTWEEVKASCQS